MKTSVVNKRFKKYDVYIGRGSKWGNPFRMCIDGTREEVIIKYYQWLKGQISSPNGKSPPKLEDAVQELKGKVLGCFCKPLACHGDILVEVLNRK